MCHQKNQGENNIRGKSGYFIREEILIEAWSLDSYSLEIH